MSHSTQYVFVIRRKGGKGRPLSYIRGITHRGYNITTSLEDACTFSAYIDACNAMTESMKYSGYDVIEVRISH